MLRPVVDQVASLAEGREVGVRVVRGVVVPVGRSQNDPCSTGPTEDVGRYPDPDPPAPAIPPPARLGIPLAAVAEMIDHPPVRAPAALAAALRPPEPDHGRKLRPVDGVEEGVLGPDRHGDGTLPPVGTKT